MPLITFTATLCKPDEAQGFGQEPLLVLPKDASAKLPSRGMTMVKGTINNVPFQAAIEPDGKGSHWFKITKALCEGANVNAGDTVVLEVESTKEWPEPKIPTDFQGALTADPEAQKVWVDITPMARWDWIRWIGAAKQLQTRQRRIEVACSKLALGKRRPCCFNRSDCTLTDA